MFNNNITLMWSILIDVYVKLKESISKTKIILFLSPIIFIWSIWQHEIMLKTFVINATNFLPILGLGQTFSFLDWAWGQDFAFFTGIHFPWGASYDFTLLSQAIAYLMLFALAAWKSKKPKQES